MFLMIRGRSAPQMERGIYSEDTIMSVGSIESLAPAPRPDIAPAPKPAVQEKAAQSSSGEQRPRAEVQAKPVVREPITKIANEATQEKSKTLAVIEDFASDVEDAIDMLNQALEKAPTKAIIARDESLNRYIVKVADENSGEVIRELPSEAILKFARNLQELKGLLFDEKT
jgi:flagellar protein FlaG